MLNSRVSAFTLLQKLIGISEKAAEIARIVRKAYWKNSSNGFIETESKSSEDVTDFKTLADVLIQAVITRELKQAVRKNHDSVWGLNRFGGIPAVVRPKYVPVSH